MGTDAHGWHTRAGKWQVANTPESNRADKPMARPNMLWVVTTHPSSPDGYDAIARTLGVGSEE